MAGDGKDGDPAMNLLLAIGLAAALGWLAWHGLKEYILDGLRWLRYGELWIINMLTGKSLNACMQWLRFAQFNAAPTQTMVALTNQCFSPAYLAVLPPEEAYSYYSLSVGPVFTIERIAMGYYRWPFMIGFIAVAIYELFMSPRNKFKTTYDLEGFIETQAKMWPVITPILRFNPAKVSARMLGGEVPDKLPLFAEALSPEEWVSWHRIPVANGIPDREASRRAFILQLGPRWHGPENEPPHIRALFAAYALKGAQKREESDALLGELSKCWTPEHNFVLSAKMEAEVKRILRDPDSGGAAANIAAQYAYRTTALMGVLRWARMNGGVLAPAQFLWVRATDRNLWYPLNNLGRRSYHIEGAGAIAHYAAEQAAQKPLPIPRIDTAWVTLKEYLSSNKSLPIPRREGDSKGGKLVKT